MLWQRDYSLTRFIPLAVTTIWALVALGLLLAISSETKAAETKPCWACSHRSTAAKNAFARGVKPYDKWPPHPCPYTAAQGCVVDHVKPLKCGGQDAPENMQWQDAESAAKKDRIENLGC